MKAYDCEWCGKKVTEKGDTRVERDLGPCRMKYSAIVVLPDTGSFDRGMLYLCKTCLGKLKKAVKEARGD
jgi:hypothetical protein